jgi:hypothetical protein
VSINLEAAGKTDYTGFRGFSLYSVASLERLVAG